jgi:predicted nucleic acid-binding protein
MTLVFDTSVLSCFSRVDKLQVLELLTKNKGRRVTTHAVFDELRQGIPTHSKLALVEEQQWLAPVAVDGLEELKLFAEFARRLVDRKNRNVGEASALAWVKVHGGIFLCDDQTALVIAKEQGIESLRTLALVANGVCRGLFDRNL